MKLQRGIFVMELVVFILWAVGAFYVARDLEHCPEVGKTPYQIPATGEWVCR